MNGIVTNVGGASHYDGGYDSFEDAIKAMVSQWKRLNGVERASIAKRGYHNNQGEDYMMAVGSYDEETGEAWDAMTLAEAIAAMEEEEEGM